MASSLTPLTSRGRALFPVVLLLCLLAVFVYVVPVDPATYRAPRDSGIQAGVSVAVGTILAVIFAWLSARTTSPLRRILTPAMALLLALPPLAYALSWSMLGLGSWPGLVVVLALKVASLSYLLIIGPIRALDSSLAEAARVAGASRLRALLGIELPALALGLLSFRRKRSYPAATHPPVRIRLGGWGWLSGSAIALFALISLGLPLGRLVIGSLSTKDTYAAVLADPRIRAAFGSTVVIGLVGGFLGAALAVTLTLAARVGREQVEAARTSGASAARAAIGTGLRLLLPSFAGGWLIGAIAAAGSGDLPAPLSPPGSPTVSTVALDLLRSGSVAASAAVSCLLVGLTAAVMAVGGIVLGLRTRPRRPAPVPAPVHSSLPEPSEVARV